jgi:hypothetical protein
MHRDYFYFLRRLNWHKAMVMPDASHNDMYTAVMFQSNLYAGS